MIDLLPCPFCGAVPVFVDRGQHLGISHSPEDQAWDVQCQTIGCYAEFGADWFFSQAYAAELWNTRSTQVVTDGTIPRKS